MGWTKASKLFINLISGYQDISSFNVGIKFIFQMERKNYHKKNPSTLLTARTKKNSVDGKSKEKERGASSKSKEKPADKALQDKISKRMSFESPNRKEGCVSARTPYQNLSLLNYMLYKEKKKDSTPCLPLGPSVSLAKEQFSVL
jgi:hypothetical protein